MGMASNFVIDLNITVNDNTEEVLRALHNAEARIFEMWGIKAEGYAVEYAPVDTSNLKNSISHKVDKANKTTYVGTDVKYAPYQEFGTGMFAEKGGGRDTPWYYKDSKGKWHKTYGNRPHPFVRPALAKHLKEYEEILYNETVKELG